MRVPRPGHEERTQYIFQQGAAAPGAGAAPTRPAGGGTAGWAGAPHSGAGRPAPRLPPRSL